MTTKPSKKDQSQIAPHEAVGVVAAQSIGEPGTQMCLDANERVIVKNNGIISITPIGKFTDSTMEKIGYKKIETYEVADLKDGIYVLALNENEKLEWKKLISCNRHAAPERLIKIKTASGRNIVATDFHSFVIRKNNKIVSIAGKELKKGDRIPSIKYLPENCIHSVKTESLLPSDIQSNIIKSEGFISTERTKTPLPEQLELNDKFGFFVGAYLSEGSLSNGEVCISNIDENYLSNVRNFADSLHLNYKEFKHHRGFAWSNDLKIRSTLLHNIIKNICDKGSASKHVPDFVYSADEAFVAGLLRGYFDGDGNVSISRKIVRVTSNSEQLIDGIKLLLTRFGIFAHKVKGKQFGLLIPYKYAPIFNEKIGSDIKKKKLALETLANLAKEFINSKSQDYTDMISGFDDLLYQIAKRLGYPTRRINNFTKRQKIGRTTLLHYINIFEKLADEKNIDVTEELKIMRTMCDSHVVWDEVASIEYITSSTNYVYDLSVEDAHTFATFDGIITHNTMRTFHYAGVAEHVPTGLPRLIEIVDAKKEPKKPVIDIHLKSEFRRSQAAVEKIARELATVFVSDVARVEDDLTKRNILVIFNEKEGAALGVTFATLRKSIETFSKSFSIQQNKILLKVKITDKEEKAVNARYVRRLTNRIRNSVVKGVRGIHRAVVIKGEGDYFIRAGGFNIIEAMEHPAVDPKRIYTNNIREIERVFGIEAARNAVVKEIRDVMDMQKLFVDIRHIMLVAEAMCHSGSVKSIGRHGLSGEKVGVLGRAAFEETIKHLIEASAFSKEDKLIGVTENIIVGQTVPVGTGKIKLALKLPKSKG